LTDYSFQEGIPAGAKADFETGIFHDPRHLQLQSLTGWHTFVLLSNKSQTIKALIHYHIEGVSARSPLRSPYSSFIFSKNVDIVLLKEFVLFTEQKLKENGVQSIVLKNPPEAYAPSENKLMQKVLLGLGYEVQLEEISAVIPITENKLEAILHPSQKKRLRKGNEQGFVFQRVPLKQLSEVYHFLKTCREEKGYTLSMSLNELERTTKIFGENFFLYVVTIDKEFAAANISIQVAPQVLYNFYHDHKASFDQVSPVVFLNEGLYQLCQKNKFSLLDLGTSNDEGQLNESLLNFKLRLGAQPSRKLTFIKNLI
jgi:hypothetical protein